MVTVMAVVVTMIVVVVIMIVVEIDGGDGDGGDGDSDSCRENLINDEQIRQIMVLLQLSHVGVAVATQNSPFKLWCSGTIERHSLDISIQINN